MPGLRAILFEELRPGYVQLSLPDSSSSSHNSQFSTLNNSQFSTLNSQLKQTIFGHPEFAAFQQQATQVFAEWCKATTKRFAGFDKDGHPKALIETVAEDLLAAFRQAPLLDAYDIYQHLMDYWAETMQDDAYLIAADGWVAVAAIASQRNGNRGAGSGSGARPEQGRLHQQDEHRLEGSERNRLLDRPSATV